MNYHYKGKSYRLELNNSGQIACDDLDIKGPSVEAVQAAIRNRVDAEKKVAPVDVYVFDDRYSYRDTTRYLLGKAKAINVGNPRYPQFWVTWKEPTPSGGERNERAKLDRVYLATPENKALLDEIVTISNEINHLEKRKSELHDSLVRLKPQA